jgi:hypothetical protein
VLSLDELRPGWMADAACRGLTVGFVPTRSLSRAAPPAKTRACSMPPAPAARCGTSANRSVTTRPASVDGPGNGDEAGDVGPYASAVEVERTQAASFYLPDLDLLTVCLV